LSCWRQIFWKGLVLSLNFQKGANVRFDPGTDPANKVKGAIFVIFVSQVSWRVHYFEMKYTSQHFCHKTMVLGGAIAPPGFAPVLTLLQMPMALTYHELKLFAWVQCKSTLIAIIVILYAFTCLATMLISKLFAEIIENHSEFYVCANSFNKFVSNWSW